MGFPHAFCKGSFSRSQIYLLLMRLSEMLHELQLLLQRESLLIGCFFFFTSHLMLKSGQSYGHCLRLSGLLLAKQFLRPHKTEIALCSALHVAPLLNPGPQFIVQFSSTLENSTGWGSFHQIWIRKTSVAPTLSLPYNLISKCLCNVIY